MKRLLRIEDFCNHLLQATSRQKKTLIALIVEFEPICQKFIITEFKFKMKHF